MTPTATRSRTAEIEWLSSDPFIATVDNGRVQTKALGVVTITATSESHRASAQLTMAPNVAVFRRLPTVFAGDTTQLVAALTDADGNLIGTGPDGWTSSDEGVAMVSTDGIVTGVSPGRATITASREAGSGGVELVVLDPAPRPARELTYVRFSATDELRRIGADGGGAIPLSDTERSVGHYDWSPLGDRLAISYYPWFGEGVAALFVENADGSDPRELLPDSVYRPAWSPDGERIAVERGTPGQIQLLNADGTNLHPLVTLFSGSQQHPKWSPDGRRISFRPGEGSAGSYGWRIRTGAIWSRSARHRACAATPGRRTVS